jgi:hypothetical protein
MKVIFQFSLYLVPFFMLLVAAIEAMPAAEFAADYAIITFEFIGAICVALLAIKSMRKGRSGIYNP